MRITSYFLRAGLALGLAALGAACASSGTGAAAGPGLSAACAREPVPDSAWAATGPVYRACEVDRPAEPDRRNATPAFPRVQGRACPVDIVAIFVVDTLGAVEPGTARITRATSLPHARALMDVLPRWRFRPAERGGERVRMVFPLVFTALGDCPR